MHPTLSIDSPAVLDGGPGDTNRLTWTVSWSAASTQTVSVRHFLATGGTANLRSDYTGLTSSERTLTFQPGETSKTFFATIVGDDVEEADETIRVGLLSPTNAVFPGGGTSLIYTLGTIVNDDPLRTLTVDSPAVPEGSDDSARNRLTFTVSLSRAIGLPVTVQYAGTNDGTARLHGASNPATDPAPAEFDVLCDWCGNVTTLTIPAGQTTATIEAYIVGDTDDEEHETLVVSFFSPSNAVFPGDAGRVDATGTILDDDGPLPVLSVNSPSVHEGGAGARNTLNFVVTLSQADGRTVTVVYNTNVAGITPGTEHGTCGGTIDLEVTNGALTFNPGETRKTVPMVVCGDNRPEDDETIVLRFASLTNAAFQGGGNALRATGTILDDDTQTLTVSEPRVDEGGPGERTAMTFRAQLSFRLSGYTATVDYRYATGTATPGTDFEAVTPGTLTFQPGDQTETVEVTVLGDEDGEGNETVILQFFNPVNVTLPDDVDAAEFVGAIVDDDGPANSPPRAGYSVYYYEDVSIGVLPDRLFPDRCCVPEGILVNVYGWFSDRDNGDLDGDGIHDEDGEPVNPDGGTSGSRSVVWEQVEGSEPRVEMWLDRLGEGYPYKGHGGFFQFVTPEVDGPTELVFKMTVTDDLGETKVCWYSIRVKDSNGSGGAGGSSGPPVLSASDVRVTEGDAGERTQVDRPSDGTARVSYRPVTNSRASATLNEDYEDFGWGTLNFAEGERVKTVTVTVLGDGEFEEDETAIVLFREPVNVKLNTPNPSGRFLSAYVTIVNDDAEGGASGTSATPPTASAGPDLEGWPGETVTLEGRGSVNPHGKWWRMDHLWEQLSGPPVSLSSPAKGRTALTLPPDAPAGTRLVFQLTVTDRDGERDADTVTVTVVEPPAEPEPEPNQAPAFDEGESAQRALAENTDAGRPIGTPVTAVDPDGDALTYGLSGNDAASFTMDADTGQLLTKEGVTYDYETKPTYSLTVTAEDGNGGSAAVAVTIALTDVDEAEPNNAPIFDEGSETTRTLAENAGVGQPVGAPVAALDQDGDALTYTLSGDDAASFDIDADTGQLRTKEGVTYDYESQPTYSVTADDGNGGEASIAVTIALTDEDEANLQRNCDG